MAMFCDQCEQTANGYGCMKKGICGKDEDIQSLQDILVYGLKGIAAYAYHARVLGKRDEEVDVNDLPLSIVLSWYEQKAVAILLTLLALGIKNIRLGPSLPAFVSPNVLKVLQDNYNIMPIGDPDADLKAMLGG